MQKSDHYHRRKWFMTTLVTPTISQVKEELGKDLAEVFFKTCPEPIKPVIGLEPLLEGPTGDLWISPSDVLIGKVCLKPPLTGKYIKALTHQGILLIGGDIEKKAANEAELMKQKALLEQEETILFSAEARCKLAIEEAVKVQKTKCAEEKDDIRQECAETLKRELHQLELKLKKEFEHALRRQKRDINESWQDQLIAEIELVISELTKNFIAEFARQEDALYKEFNLELKKEKLKHQFDLQEVRKSCQESFRQLKHQLECKNIANVMYILCAERRKCREERKHMEQSYQKRVENLQNALVDKNVEIAELVAIKNKKDNELKMREECLREILCQYQKFINFALGSCPTQAEFLLDVEKLLLFELVQTIENVKTKQEKPLMGRGILPWKTDGTSCKSKGDKPKSLVAKDYHKCYNEVDTPLSGSSVKSDEYLPAFHYNKHMYVREDFRNMMSHGLNVSRSNVIWSKHVDNLIPILRRTADDPPPEQCQESSDFPILAQLEPAADKCGPCSKTQPELGESVYSKDIICPSYDPPSKKLETDTKMQLGEVVQSQFEKSAGSLFETIKPCCTRCTQTYLKLLQPCNDFDSDEDSEPSMKSYPIDSLIKHRQSLKPKEVKETESNFKMSKLSLARDSVIVHRQSLVEKRQHRFNDSIATGNVDKFDDAEKQRKKQEHKVGPALSKLSLSKDSLELPRSQCLLPKRKMESKESIEIQDGIVGTHCAGEIDSRTVKVSHIEILPLDEKSKKQRVCDSFDSDLTKADSPWIAYGYKEKDTKKKDEIQKVDVCKVVGDKKLKSHTETQPEFTLHRAASLLSIFRKHPSLMKMFTTCKK